MKKTNETNCKVEQINNIIKIIKNELFIEYVKLKKFQQKSRRYGFLNICILNVIFFISFKFIFNIKIKLSIYLLVDL